MYGFISKAEKNSDKTSGHTASALQLKKTPNRTGIPDMMKQHFEDSSGFSMDNVRVHYNSERPAKIQALAYAQGEEVYLGPGQERHLPHELGHVIQQKEGIVQPTGSVNHMLVNRDARLEADADRRSLLYHMNCGMGGSGVPVERKAPRQIIQGIWVLIQGNTKHTNMKNNGDGTYTDTHTGRKYSATGRTDDSGHIIVVPQFQFGSQSQAVESFKATRSAKVSTTWGPAEARAGWHSQPFVYSNKENFGGAKVGTRYTDIIRGLRSSGLPDAQIATILLSGTSDSGQSDEFRRAAAMLDSVVGVAEGYRNPDAPAVCRAVLRMIQKGDITFDDFEYYFQQSLTAKKGKAQTEKIRFFVRKDDDDDSDGPPSPRTGSIISNLSPQSKYAFASTD